MKGKTVVYLLRSERDPFRVYVGLTSDLAARLETHNSGGSTHTATGRPWRVLVAVEFRDEPISEPTASTVGGLKETLRFLSGGEVSSARDIASGLSLLPVLTSQ